MKRPIFKIFSIFCLIWMSSQEIMGADGLYRPNILFIHHSVGASLIRDGSIREILTEEGFDFWDHGYNNPNFGLRNEKGKPAGCYWIPEDNTNPDGLAALFSLEPDSDNALTRILNNHDVVAFKSCFPVSRIKHNDTLQDKRNPKRRSIYNYKRHYLAIRKGIDNYPEKKFVIVTQPPLHPGATEKEEARRARRFSNYLKSEEFIGTRSNLFVFDLFDLLADSQEHTLKSEYMIDYESQDSHPNSVASMRFGVKFADFLINIVRGGMGSRLPEIKFDIPGVPHKLARLYRPYATIKGKLKSDQPLNKIIWSDLKGRKGSLFPGEEWEISNLRLNTGITKIVVTALYDNGFRTSDVIGLQYYLQKKEEMVIYEEGLITEGFTGVFYSETHPHMGRKHLSFKGSGHLKRIEINGIGLNISDLDPKRTHLEFYYDQGSDTARPRLYLPGIGSSQIEADNKPGYERIIIPFKRFAYVHGTLDRIIIKGIWVKDTNIFFDSIRLICH